MPYRVPEGLSCCQVDGHVIFLDLVKDRYFRLPERLERAFLACLRGDDQPCREVDELERLRILTATAEMEHAGISPFVGTTTPPSRSAIESAPDDDDSGLDIRTLLEVFATVCSTQLQLRMLPLEQVIDRLAQRRAAATAGIAKAKVPDTLLAASGSFRRARLHVPIEPCCLLDSLSMLRFLIRRRLSSHLVFGVTAVPFAAHCWLQAGMWVLNDTVGNVVAHTPIREV